MPFPKGTKRALAVFDRADLLITWSERLAGALGLIDDQQAIIMGKLDQILAKHEFDAVPGLGWNSLSEALTDLWQQITNTHGSVNSYGGTMVTYLSQNAAKVDSIKNTVEGTAGVVDATRDRLTIYMPHPNEGNIGDPTDIAGDGDGDVPADAMAALVTVDNPPAGWGHTAAAIKVYEPLGHFTFGHAGRWGRNRELRFREQWLAVPPGTDSFRWWLIPGITGSVRFRTVS